MVLEIYFYVRRRLISLRGVTYFIVMCLLWDYCFESVSLNCLHLHCCIYIEHARQGLLLGFRYILSQALGSVIALGFGLA